MLNLILFSLVCYFVFVFIHFLGKKKKPYKRALISLITGPVIILIINLFSDNLGVYIPLSQLSFATSIAGGIPGVALLVAISSFV